MVGDFIITNALANRADWRCHTVQSVKQYVYGIHCVSVVVCIEADALKRRSSQIGWRRTLFSSVRTSSCLSPFLINRFRVGISVKCKTEVVHKAEWKNLFLRQLAENDSDASLGSNIFTVCAVSLHRRLCSSGHCFYCFIWEVNI